MNSTTTVSIITFCIFFLSQGGCHGGDVAPPPDKVEPIDWSKYDIRRAADGDANLILWVKVKARLRTRNTFIHLLRRHTMALILRHQRIITALGASAIGMASRRQQDLGSGAASLQAWTRSRRTGLYSRSPVRGTWMKIPKS